MSKILDWPTPKSASDVQSFLGLVCYIVNFLPALALHTTILNPLTGKDAEKNFVWLPKHFIAFEAIKKLVVSCECLTVIDHSNMGKNKIFVSTDASDYCTGAVLSFGETLQTARPVAFESQQLGSAELNYPVHEKELLAIVRALRKWHVDLIGMTFEVFTDHRTLKNFNDQKHLSHRQARWSEFLGQYDFSIKYIVGSENTPVDSILQLRSGDSFIDLFTCAAVHLLRTVLKALVSHDRVPNAPMTDKCVAALRIAADPAFLTQILDGYSEDKWVHCLTDTLWDTVVKDHVASGPDGEGKDIGSVDSLTALCRGWLDGCDKVGIVIRAGLLYVGDRLVIPRIPELRECIFRLVHDSLGHFGGEKSYATLRPSYYWPNMRKELEELYVPSCEHCQ